MFVTSDSVNSRSCSIKNESGFEVRFKIGTTIHFILLPPLDKNQNLSNDTVLWRYLKGKRKKAWFQYKNLDDSEQIWNFQPLREFKPLEVR